MLVACCVVYVGIALCGRLRSHAYAPSPSAVHSVRSLCPCCASHCHAARASHLTLPCALHCATAALKLCCAVPCLPVAHCISNLRVALRHAAQVLAFALGALSPMPAVRNFSICAATAIGLDFVLQVHGVVHMLEWVLCDTEHASSVGLVVWQGLQHIPLPHCGRRW